MSRLKSLSKYKIMLASLLCLMAVVVSACSNRPDGVPSKKKMAEVLVDMYRLEAYWSVTDGPMKVENDSVRKVMRQQMLKKHGLTEAQFEDALKWYAHNIDDYVEVYEMVEKDLDKQIADASKRNEDATLSGQVTVAEGDNLWQGLPLYVLRNEGFHDGLSFDITAPSTLKSGDMLRWQMGSTARRSQVRLMLGVDYSDGTTMYTSRQISPIETGDMYVNLQTDSTLTVNRIYGVLRYTPEKGEIVMLDSIAISVHPLDIRQYQQLNSQYRYKKNGDIRRKPKVESSIDRNTDSIVNGLQKPSVTTQPQDIRKPKEPNAPVRISSQDMRI